MLLLSAAILVTSVDPDALEPKVDLDLSLPRSRGDCPRSSGDEIIVCGRPSHDYRLPTPIDPSPSRPGEWPLTVELGENLLMGGELAQTTRADGTTDARVMLHFRLRF